MTDDERKQAIVMARYRIRTFDHGVDPQRLSQLEVIAEVRALLGALDAANARADHNATVHERAVHELGVCQAALDALLAELASTLGRAKRGEAMSDNATLEQLWVIVRHERTKREPLWPGDTISHEAANECVRRGWATRTSEGDFVSTQAGRDAVAGRDKDASR